MKTTCWVYIVKNETGEITIGFTLEINEKLVEIAARKDTLSYLRRFDEPFDGLAHKHLLDTLSRDTINDIVRRHRNETEAYKEVLRLDKEPTEGVCLTAQKYDKSEQIEQIKKK